LVVHLIIYQILSAGDKECWIVICWVLKASSVF